jgi:hypothetical protein
MRPVLGASLAALALRAAAFLTNARGAGAVFVFAANSRSRRSSRATVRRLSTPTDRGPLFETPTSMLPEDRAYLR